MSNKEEKRLIIVENLKREFLNVEYGSYRIIKYLGYYIRSGKYPRHFFEKECKFCDVKSTYDVSKLRINIKEGQTCNLCNETVNVHTKEKKCAGCQIWYPGTEDFFIKSVNRRFGMHYFCRVCHTLKNRKLRESEEYRKKELRMNTDEIFKFTCNIRTRIKNFLMTNLATEVNKNTGSEEILGCGIVDFKKHLEKQFIGNMSWDNFGVWTLDHIIPISLGKNFDEIIELCYYTNYRPIWNIENVSKGTKIVLSLIDEENKIRYKKFISEYLDN